MRRPRKGARPTKARFPSRPRSGGPLGFTAANVVTIGRMILVPAFIMLVVSNQPGWAFGIFAAAGISDALDGFLARHFGRSALGAFLDPPMPHSTSRATLRASYFPSRA